MALNKNKSLGVVCLIAAYLIICYELFFERMPLRFFIAVFMIDFFFLGVFFFAEQIGKSFFKIAMARKPSDSSSGIKDVFAFAVFFLFFIIFNYIVFIMINSVEEENFLFKIVYMSWYLVLILFFKNIFLFFRKENLKGFFLIAGIKLFLIFTLSFCLVLIVNATMNDYDVTYSVLMFVLSSIFVLINGFIDYFLIFLGYPEFKE